MISVTQLLYVGLVSANTPEEIRDIISQEAVSTKLGKLEALCLKNSEDPEAFNNLGVSPNNLATS